MRLSRADTIKAKEIAEKYNISLEEVKSIIEAPYSFIRKTTNELNIAGSENKGCLGKEEFEELKTNFNLPGIGKLYASYYIYEKINNKKK